MDIHQRRIVEAAERLGVEVVDLSERWGMDAVLLRRDGRERLVLEGTVFPGLSHQTDLIATHKHAGKAVLRELGIPVPEGLVFEDPTDFRETLEAFLSRHRPVVVKPLDGTDGRGIRMGVTSWDEVRSHFEEHGERFPRMLIEEQVEGRDLRIQAIGGRLVAACVRVPATLVGDGRSTVRELIAEKNRRIAAHNPANEVDVDQQVRDLLAAEGLDLESVPAKGRSVRIKRVANMAQGATAVDVTDPIHRDYGLWIERIAGRLQLGIFSMDVLTADPAADPAASGARVLEINSRPAWLHHTFSERRRHDIPGMLVRELFRD